MSSSYYSHGKLLMTSEYLIVDGAEGLALPCKKGQFLNVSESSFNGLTWNSFDENKSIWFKAQFLLQDVPETSGSKKLLVVKSTSDDSISNHLLTILNTALSLNPTARFREIQVDTFLEFDRDWGLGSSSTLIANVAKWLEVDAFDLFFKTQNGSGYDIACANALGPITYKVLNEEIQIVESKFNPSFHEDLYFIHLGLKQKSSKEVVKYSKLDFDRSLAIDKIEDLSRRIERSNLLTEFEKLIDEHEEVLSKLLNKPCIKADLFSDYSGSVKSLGAWGGDFVLVSKRPGMHQYFMSKGYDKIINYRDMIL